MARKKSNSKWKPSVKFWLLTLTWIQVFRFAMLKINLRKERNNSSSSKRWSTGCNKWQITNLGTASRKEHKIHPFVSPAKGVKRSEAPHINKDSSPLSVLMLFFTEIFHLLVEQINVYYQQHLDRKAGPSCWLPDLTLPDMMTFVALALQMVHKLRHTTWLLVKTHTHSILWWDHDKRQIFNHTAFCRQFRETWWRWRIWPTREITDCVWHTEWGGSR